ncbi:tol-pal system YbgF family protein [Thermodesulfobacteriota bacterium]
MKTAKNRYPRIAALVLFILLLLPCSSLFAEITITNDAQFQFALETMKKGDYHRSVVEFERFIHFFPEDRRIPKARLLIGVCHLEAGEYEKARERLNSVSVEYAKTTVGGKALLFMGESYYRQGVSDEAARYFQKVVDEYPVPSLKNPALYRLGWSNLQANEWHNAEQTFKMVGRNSPLYPSAQDLSARSLEGENLSLKNPTTAGMLAIIPGLGHVYCNRYKDALVAFLLNGLFIWATVEAFDEDLPVLGGILAFVGLGFYGGNIYSAVNAAHKHNRKVRDDFRKSLSDRFDLGLFTTRQGHIGLAFRVEF